mmetsp:Transcript_2778/g.9805  ORF Transcript_2778/g.9805 Transcript_2778/m.9805 type:complete len:198 (-) Transcript_2778:26-619(-)
MAEAAAAAALAPGGHDDAASATFVSVTGAPLDLAVCVAQVASPKAGAISTFIGTTRDNFKGRAVARLEYEGYVPMAVKELRAIIGEARARWPELLGVSVHHRLGVCPVGESSVIIAVSSAHRRDGLDAVSMLIDELKARVPIWKLEVYEGDDRVWKENCECVGGPRVMMPVEGAGAGGARAHGHSHSSGHGHSHEHK